ncbi:hypothetical protein FG386_002523 [Cryptosporidium ryanae]|uniref:uncharacterized protein n=1 Tax=Cryptosporidium ryanae TaxID=515981 RepID=UPI00351A32CA|nr:hypothetical protein FG386_002523 [Cryptosporidium ryanae]
MGIIERKRNKKKRSNLDPDLILSNLTDTQIVIKKIRIPFQKSTSDELNNYSKCHALLNDKLNSIFQSNEHCRKQAADELLKILKCNSEIIHENIDKVISTISTCWVDNDYQVRKSAYKITLELFGANNIRFVSPFSDFLYMQIKNTLSHIRSDIRLDGLSFLNDYLFFNFGNYKKKFINLKYILDWSPLICRIATTDLSKTLNGIYIIVSITREMVHQIFLSTENDELFLYVDSSDIKNVATRLYSILFMLSFEIISMREQKYKDNISTSILNMNGNRKEKYERYGVKIKRTLIPNIPQDVPNDLDSILSFLTSLVLNALCYISKFDFCSYSYHHKLVKILNSFRKLHKEFAEDPVSEEKNSIFLIEHLSLIKLFSLHITYMCNEQNIEIINDFIHLFYGFIKNYIYSENYFKITTFEESQLNVFHRVFLLEIEKLGINFKEIDSIKKFFTPEKYVSFELLNSILNFQKIIFNLRNSNSNSLEVNNPFIEDIVKINNLLCKLSILIDMSHKKMEIGDIITILIIIIFIGDEEWMDIKTKFNMFMFKTLIVLPFIFNKIGYRQKYIFDGKLSDWIVLEEIILYINSQRLNILVKNEPNKNEILLAKFLISKIPELIYLLFNISINEEKEPPLNMICNLFTIICDYINNNMAYVAGDKILSLNVCKGLMSLFIVSRKFQNNEHYSILSYLPFKIQKAIISTIPNWINISNKFISLVLREVFFLLKNKMKISFSLFILKVLLSGTSDLLLPLEMKMGIISTILNNCDCSIILKFQLLSVVSESLINLFETYFCSSYEKKVLFHLFFKHWFIPLNEKIKILGNSMNFRENTLIFLVVIISKISFLPKCLSAKNDKLLDEINIPEILSDIICDSIIKFLYVDYPLNSEEVENINIIYDKLIADYLKFNEEQNRKIQNILSIKKLKKPIYFIILTLKTSHCLFNENDFTCSETFNFNSITSILNYIYERYFIKSKKLTDNEYNNISIFFLVSFWWLSLSDNFTSYIKEEKGVIKLLKDSFKENNREYMIILNHIRDKIKTVC